MALSAYRIQIRAALNPCTVLGVEEKGRAAVLGQPHRPLSCSRLSRIHKAVAPDLVPSVAILRVPGSTTLNSAQSTPGVVCCWRSLFCTEMPLPLPGGFCHRW